MIRQIYYEFLVYRSIVAPFLVVCLLAVPAWLGLRFYYLRARHQPVSFRCEALLLIFVLYLSGVAAATLAPNHNPRLLTVDTTGVELVPDVATLTCSSARMPIDSKAHAFCVYNAKGNFLLFIPLGFLIPLIWKRLSSWKGIQIAIALSVTIEILQYVSRAWGSYRAADINDVILNVLGASLGLLLMHFGQRLTRRSRAIAHA